MDDKELSDQRLHDERQAARRDLVAENEMLKKALRMFLHLQYPTWPGTPGSGGRVDAAAAVAAAKIALGSRG